MNITMQNLERMSLAEMKEFVEGNRKVCFSTEAREEAYGFIEGTLKSQQYRKLNKGQRYCSPVSGEGDRPQPGADDALGGALDEAAVHPTEGGGEEAAIRAALYRCGHPVAGIGRRRLGRSIGAGSPAHFAARIRGVRQVLVLYRKRSGAMGFGETHGSRSPERF